MFDADREAYERRSLLIRLEGRRDVLCFRPDSVAAARALALAGVVKVIEARGVVFVEPLNMGAVK